MESLLFNHHLRRFFFFLPRLEMLILEKQTGVHDLVWQIFGVKIPTKEKVTFSVIFWFNNCDQSTQAKP